MTQDTTDRTTLAYQDASGRRIILSAPWPAQSGMVPPPIIQIWDTITRTEVPFAYVGPEQ